MESALKPVREQTRSIEDRLGRMQLSLDSMARSQRERDSNTNLNRDMVLLVILVVMIQARLGFGTHLSETYCLFEHLILAASSFMLVVN